MTLFCEHKIKNAFLDARQINHYICSAYKGLFISSLFKEITFPARKSVEIRINVYLVKALNKLYNYSYFNDMQGCRLTFYCTGPMGLFLSKPNRPVTFPAGQELKPKPSVLKIHIRVYFNVAVIIH